MARGQTTGALASAPAGRSASRRGSRRFDPFPYLLVLPALTVLALVFLYPLGHSVWLSLHDYNITQPWRGMRFVGFGNFERLLADPFFYRSFGLTLYWTLGSVGGEVLLGLCGALLLNQTFAGRAIARAVILIPWAVPTVLVAIVFSTIFHANGILNELLLRAGLISEQIPFLSSTSWAMPTLIMAHVWKSFPFICVVILAGLQSIPKELYEAAAIDGAGPWQRFRYITLPGLRGVMVIAVLLATIFSLKGIDFQYIMTYGGPANSTKVIAFHAYHTAFAEYAFGRASAIAVILTIVTALICWAYLKARGPDP